MDESYEFGKEETQRIARSVIFTEKFKRSPRLYSNRFSFTLLEDASSAVYPGSVKVQILSLDEQFEVDATALLKYKKGILDNAKTGYKGECISYGNDTYYYVEPYMRRKWIGYLFESYRGIVIGMWATPTIALDGELPDFTRVYVYNILKWNFGVVGATIIVEEDRENNRWIGTNQEYECPDSRVIPPPTAPPVSSGTEDGVV